MSQALLERARETPFTRSAITALAEGLDPETARTALGAAGAELDEHAVTVLLFALAAAEQLPPVEDLLPVLPLVANPGHLLFLIGCALGDRVLRSIARPQTHRRGGM